MNFEYVVMSGNVIARFLTPIKNWIYNLFGQYLSFPREFRITDFIEIALIAVLIYVIAGWMGKARSINALKIVLFLGVIYVVSAFFHFNVILYVFNKAAGYGFIAVVVMFQPELRQLLGNLAKNKFYRKIFKPKNDEHLNENTLDAIVRAAFNMGEEKVGALIVIERSVSLDEFIESGISLDAETSRELLEQIFVHNTPLHDGAVIIRKNRVVAATCYFRLSKDPNISKKLGTRHRAAIGVSDETDSLAVVCSEETGDVSVAFEGRLIENVDRGTLTEILRKNLEEEPKDTNKESKKRFGFGKGKDLRDETNNDEATESEVAE